MGQRLASGGGVGGSLTGSGEGGQLSSSLLVLLLGLVGDGSCSKLWVSIQQGWQQASRGDLHTAGDRVVGTLGVWRGVVSLSTRHDDSGMT